jgi:hypothetical protein
MKSIKHNTLPQGPGQLRELYEHYSYERIEDVNAWAYDTFDQWLNNTNKTIEYMNGVLEQIKKIDPRLAATEHEYLDKMRVNWRVKGKGTLFSEDQDAMLSFEDTDQANALKPGIIKLRNDTLDKLRELGPNDIYNIIGNGPVVLNKGKGAPYWFSGSDTKSGIIMHRLTQDCRTADEATGRISSAGDAKLGPVATSYIRIQSGRSEVAKYELVGDKLQYAGEEVRAKVRRISAQPFYLNHRWCGVGHLIRELTYKYDQSMRNVGTLEGALRRASVWRYAKAIDLSKYDTTIAYSTLQVYNEEFLRYILNYLLIIEVITRQEADLLMSIAAFQNDQDVLLPPRGTFEEACLATSRGQLPSGIQLTSKIGTDINRVRIETKAKALGIPRSMYDYVNFGDDTMIFYNDPHIGEVWSEHGEMFGFKETTATDNSYLMKRIPQGYAYVTRMIMGTINRESRFEPNSALVSAAGIATRYQLLRGHPWQNEYLNCLKYAWSDTRLMYALGICEGVNYDPIILNQFAMKMSEYNTRTLPQILENVEYIEFDPRYYKESASMLKVAIDAYMLKKQYRVPYQTVKDLASQYSVQECIAGIRKRSYCIPPYMKEQEAA